MTANEADDVRVGRDKLGQTFLTGLADRVHEGHADGDGGMVKGHQDAGVGAGGVDLRRHPREGLVVEVAIVATGDGTVHRQQQHVVDQQRGVDRCRAALVAEYLAVVLAQVVVADGDQRRQR